MSSCLLYAGTEDGVFVLSHAPGKEPEPVGRGLEGNAVRGIAVYPDDPAFAYVSCGLRGWGLHRTRDAGRTFEPLGFEDRWVWDAAFQPGVPDTLWVGTEPPALYVSHDGGQGFEEIEDIQLLKTRERRGFFHPPFYAGHIHGFASHPRRPERLFAGVEHGALVFTRDGGQTWEEALPGHDLHRSSVDPADPDRLLAGAGEGLFESPDAGRTWNPVKDLRGRYVHAVLFDPARPERAYAYAFEKGSPLHRSDDGGRTWEPIGTGLPVARSADTLVLHPGDPNVLLYAGDGDDGTGLLFASPDAGDTWHPLPTTLPKVWRLRAAGTNPEGG